MRSPDSLSLSKMQRDNIRKLAQEELKQDKLMTAPAEPTAAQPSEAQKTAMELAAKQEMIKAREDEIKALKAEARALKAAGKKESTKELLPLVSIRLPKDTIELIHRGAQKRRIKHTRYIQELIGRGLKEDGLEYDD